MKGTKQQRKEMVEETEEQKNARWSKMTKAARTFARMSGIDRNKVQKERDLVMRDREALLMSKVHY